jgi:hypothetical protein
VLVVTTYPLFLHRRCPHPVRDRFVRDGSAPPTLAVVVANNLRFERAVDEDNDGYSPASASGLAGNVANMSPTCRPDSQMSALLADMALPCRHKIDPDTTFSCRGWPTFTPFFFLYQSTCTQPAKNLYIRNLVYNTIEQLTTTAHNNQHEPRRPTLHRL